MMAEEKKKGFFSKLFTPKSKGCCCNVQFEKIPDSQEEVNDDKKEKTEAEEKKGS